MKREFIFGCVCLLLVGASGQVFSQDQDAAVKLRLAQSFEQNSDWEKAGSLYESLFQGNPQNFVYFEGLRRSYVQLKQYDKAIDLIEFWLRSQRDNPALVCELGGVYYLKGDERAADSLWALVIKRDPRNPVFYRQVASQLMEFRLYDKAIQVFLDARNATGNSELFTDDLAMLYSAFQQYEQASLEYVSMIETRPQLLPSVQSRMSMIITRPEALAAAQKVVKEAVRRRWDNVALHRLSGWLFMESKEYDAALEEYRIIDQLTKASGSELFTFGQEASNENAYEAAGRAFKEVIDHYPSNPKLPFARFGYARSMEETALAADTSHMATAQVPSWLVTETPQGFGGVLHLYEAIIADFPRTEFAAQSYFRMGMIKLDRLFDLDGAMAAFEKVHALLPAHPLATEASLKIGEVFTMRNDLQKARNEYSKLLKDRSPNIRDHALVALAELEYFEARYDSAETMLRTFTANSSTDLANDALQFLYFIQENKSTNPEALKLFAAADLNKRQHRFSEALNQFEACITTYPQALLVDDATMKMAELKLLLGHVDDALKDFQIVVEMQYSILADRAQMRIAEVYDSVLKNKEKAIEAYEQLLIRFPRSLHMEKARTRIRILRGDVL